MQRAVSSFSFNRSFILSVAQSHIIYVAVFLWGRAYLPQNYLCYFMEFLFKRTAYFSYFFVEI